MPMDTEGIVLPDRMFYHTQKTLTWTIRSEEGSDAMPMDTEETLCPDLIFFDHSKTPPWTILPL